MLSSNSQPPPLSSQIDMVTALEICVADPLIESKINAMKSLYAKKIKSLMGVIDTLNKEINKLKVLTKDNRRTQMIQVLKNKVRDLELVADILKEKCIENEVKHDPGSRDPKQAREELNLMVIRKTVDTGPKRFRPLSREEMENKIAELEKRITKIQSTPPSTDTRSGSAAYTPSTNHGPARNIKPAITEKQTSAANFLYDESTISSLKKQVEELQDTLQTKDDSISQLNEEISRLRQRNAELRLSEEEIYIKEKHIEDMKEVTTRLQEELLDAIEQLSVSQEEAMYLSMEAERDRAEQSREFQNVQAHSESLLRQNATLLRRMTDIEREMVAKSSKLPASHDTGFADRKRLNELQEEVTELREKLGQTELDLATLQNNYNQETNKLRNSVQDCNSEIRELKRIRREIEEKLSKSESEHNKQRSVAIASVKTNTVSVYKQCVGPLVQYTRRTVQKLLEKGLVVSPPSALRALAESLLKVIPERYSQDLIRLLGLLEHIREPSNISDLELLEASRDSHDDSKSIS